MDRASIKKRVWKKIKHQVDLSAGELDKPLKIDVNNTTNFVLDAIVEIIKEDIEAKGYSKILNIGRLRADIQLKVHNVPKSKTPREFHSLRTRFRFFRKFGTTLKTDLLKTYLENAAAEGNQLVSQGDAGGC